MKIFRYRIFLPVLAIAVYLLLSTSALAGEVVRVGFFEFGDYMTRDRNGHYRGTVFEILHEISTNTGIRYKIVDCDDWPRGLQLLEQGQIDLLPCTFFLSGRENSMLFPDLPLAISFVSIAVKPDDARYRYDKPASFDGMRVGVISGARDAPALAAYARKMGIRLSPVAYTTTPALLQALRDNEVDAIATSQPRNDTPLRVVAHFSPEPFYFAVTPRKSRLLATLNEEQRRIARRVSATHELYGKYLSVNMAEQSLFTLDEHLYLNEGKPVIVAYDPDWPPLTWEDPQTRAFSGIVANLFDKIRQATGLRFQFVPMSMSQSLSMVTSGEVDIVCALSGNFLWDKELFMRTTRPYLRTAVVQIYRRDGSPQNGRRIALRRGCLISSQVAADNKDKQAHYYDNLTECLDALVNGETDMTYSDVYAAAHLLKNPRYAGLSVNPADKYISNIRMGVSRQADLRLYSILDKGLQFLPESPVDSMVSAAGPLQRETTLAEFISQNPVSTFSALMLFFLTVTLLMGISLAIKSNSNKRIQVLLHRDMLTGLPNLYKFRQDCAKLLADTGKHAYVLLFGDICQFKAINDQFGFSSGDRLLRAYGDILRSNVGEGELCARASADMYSMFLRYEGWELLLARLRHMDDSLDIWRQKEEMPYKVKTVYGAYIVSGTEGRDVQLMLDLANYARREAKRNGSTSLMLYDEQMRQETLLHQELNGRLETALREGELVPWYQIKVDMRTGAIIGSEALVRWKHPTRGLLMPDSFIPLFERNGLIMDIDMHVFTQVCKAMQSWRLRNLPLYTVSCNFSRVHFDRPGFPRQLAEIADRYAIPHELLEVEITESAIMKNPEAAWLRLIQLKQYGFKTAIDDFGAGYSSLGLVQMLNADVIKIDRSFVLRDLPGQRAQTVLGNIIRMALDLEMSVICEGVETAEQAAILMRLGCFKAQGYYYAKPEPEHEFEARLAMLIT
ncbi:MAG: EAL domain-containing protein [Desulfovibrio desulfuricans]|uniref:Diguanylate cyclase/phosphodiesterase n=1 Tax=Desulfovibrio desulfuricans (strain ATCC 27774 / DSM 6949 / MB) TaxID=525146 RepID=B8IYF2_DESDA|nr:EAL domain-containing protein [Desulfovibrio desulfuricans]